uniref:Merozoite surface protein 3 n=1 Tax=Plasmodium inui TaxID=52288 RepID=X2CM20_9APIC|nr:merozoite surface protein 3 [Plasmodium inui]
MHCLRMRQFLRISIFISLLNLYMEKNGIVCREIQNVTKTNLRNGTPEEGSPSECELPTSAQEEKGAENIKDVIKQTSEETKKFTDEAKEAKNKAAHEFLKTMNEDIVELVEISSQDGDIVHDKNEEVKEEVQTLEVEDDVDEEEEDEEDEDDDDDGDGDRDDDGDCDHDDDGDGDHDDD